MKLDKLKIIFSLFLLIFFVLMIINKIAMIFYGLGSYGINKLIIVSCFILFFIYIFFDIKESKLSKKSFYMFLFCLLLIFVTALQSTLFAHYVDLYGRSSLQFLIENTLYAIFYIFMGFVLIKLNILKDNKKAILFLLATFFVIWDVSEGEGFINYYNLANNLEIGGEVEVNHMVLGPLFYFLFIFIYSLSKTWVKIFSAVMILYMLFVLGGRGDLILFLLSIVTLEIVKGLNVKRWMFILMAFLLASTLFLLNFSNMSDNDFISRMIISDGLKNDESYLARVQIFEVGLRELPSQFFVGNISSLIKNHNNLGAYIHNFISIWQFYGFFVFLCVFFIFFYGVKYIKILRDKNLLEMSCVKYDFYVLILCSAIYGLLLMKAANYYIFWIAIGSIWGFELKSLKSSLSILDRN